MSSGNSAFVDLTSSSRTAVHDGPATMSTVDLADPSLDFTDTEALRELRQDHDVLRRKFLATRRRREDLDRQLAGAANAASPYVLFCQRKYEVVHHQLESTQKELAECLDAQQERLDNSHELEACRLRYRDLLLRYNEAVYDFQDRVFILEVQLAAASSFEVIIPPDTARRIADLESQLARSQSVL
ncbi:hypothetical protein F441_21811 [Phytophthora nicotianae CJ01A1]|uniref:Uncharacterized protein n=1 Tax=Phytophthora nicotianae CJ01A1 TaxID=1317063 RepID=W2VU07_PHYNI|nr:hypothetical protein F441_21811 [Phytophthora nicotianae CJ01A1]